MRKLAIFFLLIAAGSNADAQVFGGTPPSQKWKQIDTDTARIIFTPGMDSQAKRVASVVHYIAQQQPASLGNQLKKINIVLQNQTTVANGYVGLGPYRSEYFMTPDMNSLGQGSISWTDQLALHEYRHVQQFNNFNNGLSRFTKTIFGEDGYAVAINASIPDWFYEGDAVYAETVLSKQGRGRLPSFMNAYPALWNAGKKYSWMKLRNGSLKDYVPNHYNLGYLLVNYGYEKYGADFWAKVTKDASAYKGLLYPFQMAVKKYAGVSYNEFVKAAFDFYKKVNSGMQMNGVPSGDGINLQLKFNPPAGEAGQSGDAGPKNIFKVNKSYVTNYLFPYAAGTDSLVYLKTSYRQRPTFYIKDKTGEHRLGVMDISLDDQYSYRNGKIVYAAYENDARWQWRDYSVIKLLDVKTNSQKTLTTKSKYFTPDISDDGTKVAAVQVAENGKSELHVLNAEDGKVIKAIHSSEINLFADPKFMDGNTIVTAVRLNDGRMALASAEISSGILKRITPPSYNVVGYPCVHNGLIYFIASYGGNDDVFVYNPIVSTIHKLTNGPQGSYFVNVSGNTMTWSAFTSEGYQLQQLDLKNINWKLVDKVAVEQIESRYAVGGTEITGEILLSKVPARSFDVKDYKKSTKLVNIHSWRPYYEDPLFTFSLYGQNVLNTLETELYYQYNQNDKTNAVGFNAVFGGFFPYLNAGTEYTFNREALYGTKLRQWRQLDTRIGLSLPLSKAKGKTYRNFNVSSFYVLRNEFNKGLFKDSADGSFTYLSHNISWSQQVERARQHILPRLGYSLSAGLRHAVSAVEGRQIIGNAALYLPGVMSNHNLVLNSAFQERDTLRQVLFSDRFAYSRGYTGRYFSRMWKLSANYHFPLWHTDWGFGNILYLQRIRANAFYDFTKVYSINKLLTADQRSVGGEMFFDTKWWNQYELTFGFRVSHLLDRDQYDGWKGTLFELVMPVSIIPR
ncbi:MAG: hypothetical protein IPH18_16535 [Chitinophagaceae bacterium]|nr:hypothetical protein [Chitinophagaceae bacterium]